MDSLETLAADYIDHQQSKGLAPKSMESIEYTLKAFRRFLKDKAITEASQLDQRVLDRYSTYLLTEHKTPTGKSLARASVRTAMRTIGGWIKWLQFEDQIGPKLRSRQPRDEHRLLETLSRDEINRLENAASTVRDALIIRTLADSGIRLGELLGLRATDLRELGRDRYIKVTGKGRRDRLIQIEAALYMRLKRYAERDGERIFMTNRKRHATDRVEALRPRSVQNMLKFTAKTAGLKRSVNPHLLRHSFATEMVRQGMDLIRLKDILGHSDLSMISKYYTHLNPKDSGTALMEILARIA